ncbi:MAG: histidine kinase dimerization/phosphoacceptor domain -containing protein, partial [Saprospiraceae bacterium]
AQEAISKKEYADSALVWLNENYVDNPENYHQRALQTLERAYQSGNPQFKAEVHFVLMRWHDFHVPFTIDSIMYHGEKAINLFNQTHDQANLADASAELALQYIEENDLKRSEELIFDAIEIYEELNNKKGLGDAYRRLSIVCLSQNEPNLAKKYGLIALEMVAQSKDFETESLTWLALLWAYDALGEYENAIHAGDQCIEIIQTKGIDDEFTLARAYAYRGDVWAELGNYQNSVEDNSKSYAIIKAKIGEERPAAKTYRQGIGIAYYHQGEYQKALPHYEAAIEGYVQLGQDGQPKMQQLLEDVADCYFNIGDYKNAYQSRIKAHQIFDTLMQNKVANLESEALIKYETGKKDQKLEEQSTIIKQKDRIEWMGGGLIGLLLLFTSTLFYFYRKNQKTTEAIKLKNEENELLLKEIHHRVKNNLQTISSLLSLQSESISDKTALDAVQESKNRVASMALIHQKLYQGDNLAAIEMRDYFETIGRAVKDSFGEKARHISFDVDMSRVELDVDTAIPIGLITNELITNSLKHAFPKNQEGQISIQLSRENNGLLKLKIADNGVGIPAGLKEKDGSGFGTLLIQLLTSQLGGTLEKSNEEGTATIIQFPLQEKSVA